MLNRTIELILNPPSRGLLFCCYPAQRHCERGVISFCLPLEFASEAPIQCSFVFGADATLSRRAHPPNLDRPGSRAVLLILEDTKPTGP